MRIVDAGNGITADGLAEYEELLRQRVASREAFAAETVEPLSKRERRLWNEIEAIDRFERSER